MAIISILANIILGVMLMQPLAHAGLALATSLASILNLGLLLHALRAKLGVLGWRDIARSAGKTLLGSAAMGIVVWTTAKILIPAEIRTVTGLWVGVVTSIGIGICVYGALSFVLKSQELSSVLLEARKGIGRR
jgi:putative peptidoglycan lipid II flippase